MENKILATLSIDCRVIQPLIPIVNGLHQSLDSLTGHPHFGGGGEFENLRCGLAIPQQSFCRHRVIPPSFDEATPELRLSICAAMNVADQPGSFPGVPQFWASVPSRSSSPVFGRCPFLHGESQ